MRDKVLDFIKKNNLIENGDSVLVGISGGPDSVCLLHVLNSMMHELNISIQAVHINHMLRGEESDCDEAYVAGLCDSLSIPLQIFSIDIEGAAATEGISVEEAGRNARYRAFEAVADKIGAGRIAVAHNMNDQAETVLMNILRGTGLDGLKGMASKRGRIIRPLLGIERGAIEEYCRLNQLNPRTDSSNKSSIYTRNRVRLELIPFINKQFEADIVSHIYNMTVLVSDDIDFIENFSREIYNNCIVKRQTNGVFLDVQKLASLHPAIRKRVVRRALKEIKTDLKGVEDVHVESIVRLILKGRTGSEVHLPCRLRASKIYDNVKIFIDEAGGKPVPYEVRVEIPGMTPVDAINTVMESEVISGQQSVRNYMTVDNTSLEQFFDYEKLSMGINIRNRRNGDQFKPYKSNGTKKLKEYFIDNKFPRDTRDTTPLIALESEIVWIIGHKISDKFKVTENTKYVLRLSYINRG